MRPPPLLHSLSSYTQPPLATLIKHCKSPKCVYQIHSKILKKGLSQDNYLLSKLFSSSLSLSSPLPLSYVTSVFSHVTLPNTCLYNSLLSIFCHHSTLLHSLSLFNTILSSGVGVDEYTFPLIIKKLSGSGSRFAFRVGLGVHAVVFKVGVYGCVFVGSSLVDFYGKCGEVGFAEKVFDEMPVRNVVTWTSLLGGYLRRGEVEGARRVFDEMPKRNKVSWTAMVRGYAKVGMVSEARMVFEEMPWKDVVSYTVLIDGYAKVGDMEEARGLFEECGEKDVVIWSALISGYVQNGMFDEAMECFVEMERCGSKVDEFVMVSVMSACAQSGRLELAKWIDSYVCESKSFDLQRAHVAAALVNMNVKCGNMERATYWFSGMAKRDLVSYCSLIQGHVIHGSGVDAVKLFYDMVSEGLTPDEVAFTVILTACSRDGLVEEGYRLFDMMKNKYCIPPSPDHYACLVDLLGRDGHLESAYDLLKSTPVESHAGAWGALLGACKLHGDARLGEIVGNRLVEIEPQNAGNFVLLSNIYAAAERWVEVSTLRSEMKGRGLKKIAGRSCV